MMNDKIKEIIRKRKQKIELNKSLNVQGYYDKEDKALLDYITNLQQENQELNDSITWWNNRFNAVQRDYEELKQENERLKLERYQLKQKLEAKNKRIKMIKDILNGKGDE